MSKIITQIALNNFKSFKKEKISIAQFDSQLNILSGPNGFGKTTIFDAIELVFSHRMTRFVNHEHGRQTFEQHLLLNDTSEKGFIVINTLVDGRKIQHVAIINNDTNYKHEEFLERSISYFRLENEYHITNFEKLSPEEVIQHAELHGIESPEPIIKMFNICYYVSQENSTHLLKLNIKSREDTLAPLIGNKIIEDKYSPLKEAKDLFDYNETEIQNLLRKIHALKYDESIRAEPYVMLFPNIELEWDSKRYKADDNTSKNISKLKLMRSFKLYKEEIFKHEKNKMIDDFIKSNETIKVISTIYVENIETVELLIEVVDSERRKKLEVKNLQNLYHEIEQNLANPVFRIRDTEKIKSQIENLKIALNNNNFEIIPNASILQDNLAELLNKLNKRIIGLELHDNLSKQKLNLQSSRKNIIDDLDEYTKLVNKEETHCPLCNTEFESVDELRANIDSVSSILDQIIVTGERELAENWQDVETSFVNIRESFSGLEKKRVGIDWSDVNINAFLADPNNVKRLERLLNFIKSEKIQVDAKGEWSDQLKTKKFILGKEFLENLQEMSVDDFIDSLKEFLNVNSLNTLNRTISEVEDSQIKQKIEYFRYLQRSASNTEYQKLNDQVKNLVREKLQWDKLKIAYQEIVKNVNLQEKNLKKSIVEAIRVPLLIYTAKMLQNYQGGLGVYIEETVLRFVSSQKQPDILNKFSSGQLSAFVLTFLLLMNKLYVSKEEDFQFVLIDDPVQTMDEINLSSFVDVLRREFQDKQIILSTHEEDKKNYIGYKFVKNGSSVNILNVKDQWYTTN